MIAGRRKFVSAPFFNQSLTALTFPMHRKKLYCTLLIHLLFFLSATVSAQYADRGTGSLKNQIWWFDWNGFSFANGASKTIQTPDGLSVTIEFSDPSGPLLAPSVMNTWSGAVLHLLYDFSDPSIRPALYNARPESGITKFSLSVTATRNNIAVPINFIMADAEASDLTEITTLSTNGSPWNTIDFFRNSTQASNPVIGCGTKTIKVTDTYGNAPAYGQNPVVSSKSPAAGSLTVDVTLDHTNGSGLMGLAFGVLEGVDRGDLPPSYSTAQHQLTYTFDNSCNYLPPYPTTTQISDLWLGTIPGDADGQQTTNDNASGTDEDALGTLPLYTGDGTYELKLPVTNKTGANAYAGGWFDMNGNGIFDHNELSASAVAPNATSVVFVWTSVPAQLPTNKKHAFRFRISSIMSDAKSSSSTAPDGEVEDYFEYVPQNVSAGFAVQDTVCVNTAVNITNTSTGASNYYWNFCVANSTTDPVGTNLGNFGFSLAVFVDYAKDGDNWYAFVTNNMPGKLVRLDFGNSLLNTPTAHDFGNLGGVIPNFCEGIQLVKNEGRWYAVIVGDQPVGRIVKIDFGPSLSNNSPIATNWGNVGNLAFPTDLHLFQSGNEWYGLTINAQTNTITRFNFSSSFTNVPTGVNLGNIGSLDYPTGIYAVSKNGTWHAFVTNQGGPNGNSLTASLTRLDFGNSLLNIPAGTNLGNPGNALRGSRDISIYQSCNEIFGYVVNNSTTSDIVRLNFNNSLTAVPTAVSLGNTGGFGFPHCISKLFRVGSDLYSFVANASNNTITRLRFEGCGSASVSNSTEEKPPPVTYNKAGVYNINLTTDEGLPTQSAYCRQVVVLGPPVIATRADTTICAGDAVQLTTTAAGAASYSWSPAKGLSDSSVASPVATPAATTQYVLTVTNAAGCTTKDTVLITVRTAQQCAPVIPRFTTKDTVCVNTPVAITNTSSGASSYYWNFCVADLNTAPVGENIGNTGSNLSQPVFMDYAFDKGNYYGFVINHYPGGLIRLDFGNNLLNTPSSVNLGNFGGVIPPGYGAEGIQVVQNEGRWYAIVVGGYQPSGSTPRILKIDFGPDLNNPIPVATDWGNLGNMSQPIDLHVFKEGDRWFGFTLNAENNTITRFDFTTSFANVPTAVNLGNIGNLAYPTGIYAINDNGFWRVFITNAGGGANNTPASLSRLDFGNSLLNAPVGVNLGNPGNALKLSRDLTIMRQCGQIVGFVVNAKPTNDIVKMDFHNDLSATPDLTSLGNIGNAAFPHSISRLFRVQDDIYGFVTNVDNNSLTRLRFTGCTSADRLSSTQENPSAVTYNKPGVYNINLTVDDGLPTQAAYCRQVVVLAGTHTPLQVASICAGDSVLLSSSAATGTIWNNGSTTAAIYAKTSGLYWASATMPGGCVNIDSFRVDLKPMPVVNLGPDRTICTDDSLVIDAGNTGAQFNWQNGHTSQQITVRQQGLYHVAVAKDGCVARDTINVSLLPTPLVSIGGSTTICRDGNTTLTASGGSTYAWAPTTALSNPMAASTSASPLVTTVYTVTASGTNGCSAKDSVTVKVDPKPVFSAFIAKPVICKGDTVSLMATGGDRYSWSPATGLPTSAASTIIAAPPATMQYKVLIEEDRCGLSDSLFVSVRVVDKPVVLTTKSNDITCFLGEATLATGGGNRYRWQPTTGLSDATSARPVVKVNITTSYHVQVTTPEGCVVEDSVTVNVVKGEGGFPVPDAFTPNSDGKNDCFGVRYWGDVQEFSLNLYNRWGELIFHADQPSQCWNGIYKGQAQPGDVYVYLVKAKTRCGEVVRKGTFVLVR
jgi:gliding motility-associated-like protein